MTAPRRTFRPGDPFGMRDARGRLVLDADAARELNAIRAELRRLDKVAVAPPLEYGSDASGRRWGLAMPESIYVKLTGSTSPYSWAEASRTATNVSTLLTGGRTGTAYEANAATGLGGQFATIDWSDAGDWRFQVVRDATGGGGTGVDPGSPCICHDIPATLTLTSHNTTCGSCLAGSSCNSGFPSSTLVYNSTGHYWLSPYIFTPGCFGGGCFRSDAYTQYRLTCIGTDWQLDIGSSATMTPPTSFAGLYQYHVDGTTNTCPPFALNVATGPIAFPPISGAEDCPANSITIA